VPSPYQSVRPGLFASFRDILRIGRTIRQLEVAPVVAPVAAVSGLNIRTLPWEYIHATGIVNPAANEVMITQTVPTSGWWSYEASKGQTGTEGANKYAQVRHCYVDGVTVKRVLWWVSVNTTYNFQSERGAVYMQEGEVLDFTWGTVLSEGSNNRVCCTLKMGRL
jgi:hypothetical protein